MDGSHLELSFTGQPSHLSSWFLWHSHWALSRCDPRLLQCSSSCLQPAPELTVTNPCQQPLVRWPERAPCKAPLARVAPMAQLHHGLLVTSLAVGLQQKEKASAPGVLQGSCYLDPQVVQPSFFYYYCSKISAIISVGNYQTHSQNHTREMPN